MNIIKRHLFKTITWRIIGSLDTLLLAYFITGSLSNSLKISGLELITKMFLYYFHERVWFKSSYLEANKRHLYKTFTWRFIATSDTVIISTIISGNPISGFKIGIAETFTKMILYYFHEKIWYKFNFGLNKRIK